MTTDDPETGLPPGVTPGSWAWDVWIERCGPDEKAWFGIGRFAEEEVTEFVCVSDGDMAGHDMDKHMANARLIAAAPDLYRALVRLRAWVVDEVGAELPCESIDAALAAARREGE